MTHHTIKSGQEGIFAFTRWFLYPREPISGVSPAYMAAGLRRPEPPHLCFSGVACERPDGRGV